MSSTWSSACKRKEECIGGSFTGSVQRHSTPRDFGFILFKVTGSGRRSLIIYSLSAVWNARFRPCAGARFANSATSTRLGAWSRCHVADWLAGWVEVPDNLHATEQRDALSGWIQFYSRERVCQFWLWQKAGNWTIFTPAPSLNESARHPAAEKWGNFTLLLPIGFVLVACHPCLQLKRKARQWDLC